LVTFSEHIPLIEQMFEQPQPATSARTIKQPFLQYDNSCAPEMFRRIIIKWAHITMQFQTVASDDQFIPFFHGAESGLESSVPVRPTVVGLL
jgi:hypothetical protein